MTMIFKPETGLDGLFQAFASDNWPTVRDAVDQGGLVLRHAGMDQTVHARLGEQMHRLAKHGKWEVRKALAHAVLFLRHKSFSGIIAILSRDDNSWVKNAAKMTKSRRSELSKADLLKEQHGDLMLKWLNDLEGKHGVRSRNAARRVSEKLNAQFIKELNHELAKVTSPLDTSLGKIESELTQQRMNRANIQRHASRARSRLEFLVSIMDSLRSLTQNVDHGFQVESLLSIVDEAVHLVRDRKEENRRLETDVQIPPELTVEVNRHLLLQALSNIIQNSVESYDGMETPPMVIIEGTMEDAGRAKLTITDRGSGMSTEAVHDAFRLFSTSKPNGTGFGLTVAQKIIESDHGGAVHLESAKDRGTTVTIFLHQSQEGLEW